MGGMLTRRVQPHDVVCPGIVFLSLCMLRLNPHGRARGAVAENLRQVWVMTGCLIRGFDLWRADMRGPTLRRLDGVADWKALV